MLNTLSRAESDISETNKFIINNETYVFIEENVSWSNAYHSAQEKNGHLAIFTNLDDFSKLMEYKELHFPKKTFWIGLTDSKNEGHFEWIDGSSLQAEFYQNTNNFTSFLFVGENLIEQDYVNVFSSGGGIIARKNSGELDSYFSSGKKTVEGYILQLGHIEEKKQELAKDNSSSIRNNIKSPYESIKHNLLLIETDLGKASAFIGSSDRKTYIYTNIHVLNGITKLSFSNIDNKIELLNLSQIDKFFKSIEIAECKDIVRLQINAKSGLPITNSISLNTPIFVYGNSQGDGYTELSGEVKAVSDLKIEVSAEFTVGNSGGPVVDTIGNVYAISSYIKYNKNNARYDEDTRWSEPRRFAYKISNTSWKEIKLASYNRRVGNDLIKLKELKLAWDAYINSKGSGTIYVTDPLRELMEDIRVKVRKIKKNRERNINYETQWISEEFDRRINYLEYATSKARLP